MTDIYKYITPEDIIRIEDEERINNKDSLIDSIMWEVSYKGTTLIENMVSLHLRHKPIWMPKFIWYWLIKRMLILVKEIGGTR